MVDIVNVMYQHHEACDKFGWKMKMSIDLRNHLEKLQP